ncbi:hypothetical protein ACROYT_G017450 [Oculina patagonica]
MVTVTYQDFSKMDVSRQFITKQHAWGDWGWYTINSEVILYTIISETEYLFLKVYNVHTLNDLEVNSVAT